MHKHVLILPDPEKTETESGILVQQEQQKATFLGKIMNVGSAVQELTEGDHVLYSGWAYEQLSFEGDVYHIVDERDVLALVDENPIPESQ